MQFAEELLGNEQSGSCDSVKTMQPRLTFFDAYTPSKFMNSSAAAEQESADSGVARPVEAAQQ
jgi:hypothetical protein